MNEIASLASAKGGGGKRVRDDERKGGCATNDDNSQRQRPRQLQPWSTVPEAPFPGGTESKSVPWAKLH